MIRCALIKNAVVTTGGIELIEKWEKDTESCLWIDFQKEDLKHENELLIDRFNLDRVAVSDAQRHRYPPKSEAFNDHVFILLKASVTDNVEDFSNCQFALFMKDRLLVSRHDTELKSIDKFYQSESFSQQQETPSSYDLALKLINCLSDDYGGALLRLENRLSEIEDDLFSAEGDRLVEELITYSTQLKKIKRILAYQVGVIAQVRSKKFLKNEKFDPQELASAHETIERFFSLSDMYEQVVKDLIDGFISLNGHRLNNIMKVLTVVTVIFVPLTLLVGIYGMNFENIPELKSQNGYYMLLSAMVFISVGLLFVFRRKKWI